MEKISSIRRGKTIKVKWKVTADIPLTKDKLTLELIDPVGKATTIDPEKWTYNSLVIEYTHEGTSQRHIGKYGYTLWYNKGQKTQTVVDKTIAYILVSHTECECPQHRDNLELTTVDLGESEFNAVPVIEGGGGCDCELISKEEVASLFDVSNIHTDDGYELVTTDEKLLFVDDKIVTPEPEPEPLKWIALKEITTSAVYYYPFVVKDRIACPLYVSQMGTKLLQAYSETQEMFVPVPELFDFMYDRLEETLQKFAIPYSLCPKDECVEFTGELGESYLGNKESCLVYILFKNTGVEWVSLYWRALHSGSDASRIACIKINEVLYPMYTNAIIDCYMEYWSGLEPGWISEGSPWYGGRGDSAIRIASHKDLVEEMEYGHYHLTYELYKSNERVMSTPDLRESFMQAMETCEQFRNHDY